MARRATNTIHLSDVGVDEASGSPGKDRFVLNGEPTAVGESAPGKPVLAHTVTDFTRAWTSSP